MRRLPALLGILLTAVVLSADGNDAYAVVSDWYGIDPNAGQNSFLTLLIPSGGKYEGMATAHAAVALDGGYLEANPAAGSYLPRTVLSFSHNNYIDTTGIESITYAFRPDRLEDMSFGINVKLLHVDFPERGEWGQLAGSGWYTEMIGTASMSYNFFRNYYFDGLSVGGSFKIGYRGVTARLEPGQNAVSLMGDFGLMTRFNLFKGYASRERNFAVGLMAKNLGAEFIEDPDPLPSYFSAGLAYNPIRPLTLAFDVNVPFNLNGEPAEQVSFATGFDLAATEFLSLHGGMLIKTGKPRLTMGADIVLNNMSLVTNFTLDLATQLEVFNRMSVAVKIDLETVRQFLIKDDVQELYLQGLDYYARGQLIEAVTAWENCLSLDPSYTPAQEMIETATRSLNLQRELSDTLNAGN